LLVLKILKLNYYVPVPAKEKTKQAFFDLGIEKSTNYKCCKEELTKEAIKRFKEVHAYKKVAYEVL